MELRFSACILHPTNSGTWNPNMSSMFFRSHIHHLGFRCFCSGFSTAALKVRTCTTNRSKKVVVDLKAFEAQEKDSCQGSIDRDHFNSRNRVTRIKLCSEMLRDIALEMSLIKGKAVHGYIIRSRIEPDLHLWISLINFYAKCDALGLALNLFEKIPMKSVVSWTALISGFVARGLDDESIRLFYAMKMDGVAPNEFTYATIFKGCSKSLNLKVGRQLHAEVVKSGVLSDAYIGSALIDLYSKCREMQNAYDVFSMVPEKNTVLWNVLLNGYAQIGDGDAILQLFCEMVEPEMRFSKYTLSIVFKGIASLQALRVGQSVHSMAIKTGGDLDDFVRCSLVNMYSKCGAAADAYKMFKMVRDRDTVAWSAIISVFDQQGLKEEALHLFFEMQQSGARPNEFTFSSVVSAATDLGHLSCGRSIHGCAYKLGLESDDLVSNALLGMYMKFRLIFEGYRIFYSMPSLDVVSWNALLSGFHDDNSNQGIRIFMQMLIEGFKPNIYTYISTLRSCSSFLNIESGKQVHSHLIKGNLANQNYVGTALIDMYAKCGCIQDAEAIFSRLGKKDVFTWTVIIAGNSQINQGEKAARCLNQMRSEGFVPNEFTLASCLGACSSNASLETGRQLHSLVIKAGHSSDIFVASSLVDMYVKCGCIDEAEILFNEVESGDTVFWNTVICGYSLHGDADKALQAFRTMLAAGVSPDEVTFVGILSACSHNGLVKEAREHFDSMSKSHGVIPGIEHYACMIDVLGRAGKFSEVESLIEEMRVTPDSLIWENVLGACRLHGNVELGEKAAQRLFQIDPQKDSNYILLSNLYCRVGRWSDASKVRESMSSNGIKKEPGCSWTEVDGHVHVFLSGDASHLRLTDIDNKLEELRQRAFETGYVPNMQHVLHNMTDDEKKDNLFRHSERLALGFALISKINGGKIRIFKNLRICMDCHEFIKSVSKSISHEIVVRDARRFHHFYNGTCSCKDYW